MASNYTPPVQALIDELGRLPGIGPKSAQRIAFHLLKVPVDDANRLAHAITDAKAARAKSGVAKGAYEKLRGAAKKNVEQAVPRLGKLIEKHAS